MRLAKIFHFQCYSNTLLVFLQVKFLIFSWGQRSRWQWRRPICRRLQRRLFRRCQWRINPFVFTIVTLYRLRDDDEGKKKKESNIFPLYKRVCEIFVHCARKTIRFWCSHLFSCKVLQLWKIIIWLVRKLSFCNGEALRKNRHQASWNIVVCSAQLETDWVHFKERKIEFQDDFLSFRMSL